MKAAWKRRGLILQPSGQSDWWASHAQAVTPLVLSPCRWRLFFAARDSHNRSHIIHIDVDPRAEMRVLDTRFEPILDLGPPGTFDSAGQGPSMALKRGERIDLYYVGVHLRRDVDYGVAVGLASCAEDGHFERRVPGPVLSTGPYNPYLTFSLFIVEEENRLTAWHVSGVGWIPNDTGALDPIYDLKRAYSSDGIFWKTAPTGGLPLRHGAAGLGRPWIADIAGEKIMFFSSRGSRGFRKAGGETYRIWSAKLRGDEVPEDDTAPIVFENPAQAGDWDFEMQEYASVLPLEEGYVMFYNGNAFGQSGFGWATLGL